MFETKPQYPLAIASYDDEGVDAAIQWCLHHMQPGHVLTVWTAQKNNLRNSPQLETLVNRHRDVQHLTARGGAYLRGSGPVLMAWPDVSDIAEFSRSNSSRIQALCVVNWNTRELAPWVAMTSPEILGDASLWNEALPTMDPVVEQALVVVTQLMNHNNTISGGYEKDLVVGALLALREAGLPMDATTMEAWAVAHGWTGRNPRRLRDYVDGINTGKTPRTKPMLSVEFVAGLRRDLSQER